MAYGTTSTLLLLAAFAFVVGQACPGTRVAFLFYFSLPRISSISAQYPLCCWGSYLPGRGTVVDGGVSPCLALACLAFVYNSPPRGTAWLARIVHTDLVTTYLILKWIPDLIAQPGSSTTADYGAATQCAEKRDRERVRVSESESESRAHEDSGTEDMRSITTTIYISAMRSERYHAEAHLLSSTLRQRKIDRLACLLSSIQQRGQLSRTTQRRSHTNTGRQIPVIMGEDFFPICFRVQAPFA
ncbi:hypothetical protein GGR56DRAFT_299939 [Xylariaceae sp. FL0804]|nr:hypothetical protein GGR56DRAFT_299939 [Xylariaceae sp. FL0804]